MDIMTHSNDGRHVLQLNGRLDANWAQYLGTTIESAVRGGQHHIDIDLAHVDYISSAGIGIILQYYHVLRKVQGTLRVVNPTTNVLDALKLCKIDGVLLRSEERPNRATSSVEIRRWERNGTTFESHPQTSRGNIKARLIGQPEKFATGQLSLAESVRTVFEGDVFGLGLGAFGSDIADSSERIGEFLAIGGAAITQPTDGSSVPDFQLTDSQLLPEVNVLYGMTATGGFSQLLRFEAGGGERGVIPLSELIAAAFEELNTSAVGFAIVAESASLVGATLRQSPVHANGQSPFNFPAVRDWLSFTSERADERHVAVIVGFAIRKPEPANAAFFHALGLGTETQGHFHAAVFPYRPLPKGPLSLSETINSLFGSATARNVMHLLADDRKYEGVGETELMRGACWIGPLDILDPANLEISSLT